MTVEIHELDADFLESALGQQVTFDTRQGFVGIVVSLFNQPEFFTLRLVETRLDAVSFLKPFQGEDKQFRVVLVGERRELDRRKATRFQPVDRSRVDGNGLFWRDVRAVFQVVVLTLFDQT